MSKPILTAELVRELLDYDPETGIFVWKRRDRRWFKTDHEHARWNCRYAGKVAGSLTVKGYVTISVFKRPITAHRLAWLYVHGYLPTIDLDHKDRDSANNRLSNLRLATRSQNKANSNPTNGYRGVCWNKRAGKYVASIKKKGDKRYLGYFKDPVLAAKAYDRAAVELFGEFASLNFP